MRALRIILHQNSANYRKEETIYNKMTYPLPPLSTIIGALHGICGYTDYHEMDISVQGRYGSMHRESYTDYCFLNSIMDDRGKLVKMNNASMLSTSYQRVADALKPQGNSFANETTVLVHNRELLTEYQQLKKLAVSIDQFKKERIEPVLGLIKKRKANLSIKKKQFKRGTIEFERLTAREQEIKNLEKEINSRLKTYKEENYEKPISNFRSLTTSLKYYEVLDDVNLIIHVKAEDDILEDILDNIYELKALGRSEDFVSVGEAKMVELSDELREEEEVSKYAGYYDLNLILSNQNKIFTKDGEKRKIIGTKYLINKKYDKPEGRRIFKKVKVLYASEVAIYDTTNNLYMDYDGEETYIVNFL
ncbi:CRISPR-associated protein Cas5 [Konateibacter massiliensis]|uniref:CRISPR-associated protein Cas5 n=1 Tax=Konateibacter massiliensis TaxID=2002841 RepID=UPI000C14D353|nr:CRISPR-associated protein Cas5 [Konateibacter massiliensis]